MWYTENQMFIVFNSLNDADLCRCCMVEGAAY